MKKETFPILVDRMSKNDTTHGWDILVSYDLDKINNLLQKNPLAVEKISQFKGDCTTEDDDGELATHTYQFELNIDQPTLKFAGQSGHVTLRGPVKGSYQKVSPHAGHKIDFKDGFSIEYNVELKNVKGSYREENGQTKFSPDTSSDKYRSVPTNYVVPFADDNNSARGICLGFSGAKVTLKKEEGAKISALVEQAFNDGIGKALEHLPSEHFITGLTKYSIDLSMIVFQPVSFCFTVQRDDIPNNIPGALLMWIAVKGGHNNGQRDSGTTELVFNPDSDGASPIPEGSSASIIFSHDIMANHFFKPALESTNSFKDVVVKSEKGQAGLQLEGSLQSGAIEIEKIDEKLKSSSYDIIWTCDAIGFPTSSPPTTIKVAPGIVNADTPAVEISFTSKVISAHWTDGILYHSTQPPSVTSGTIKGTFSWGARGSWSGGTEEHPNLLQFTFSKDSKWTNNTKGEQPGWLDKFLQGGTTEIPNFVGKAEPPQPKVNLEMKVLDYFLVTNLLFPGQHLFHAHTPASSDQKTGLAVPRDFILTGDVMEQQK